MPAMPIRNLVKADAFVAMVRMAPPAPKRSPLHGFPRDTSAASQGGVSEGLRVVQAVSVCVGRVWR